MSARRGVYVSVLAAVAISAAVVWLATSGAGAGTSQWPQSGLRDLTHLSGLPGAVAPDFTLTDQRGHRVSLASLRGRVVVLEPMDPQCTNVCPLISEEFIYAAQTLGSHNRGVEFVGINVNQFHASTAQVLAFSRLHHLDRLPNWEFLTGSTMQLRHVWHDFAIAVLSSKTGDVTHSALMYFIDAHGHERWLAFPSANPGLITQWGQAIAAVTKHLMT